VKEVRKIAVERDTTLTGLVRECSTAVAAGSAASGRKWRERAFNQVHLKMNKRTWRHSAFSGIGFWTYAWSPASFRSCCAAQVSISGFTLPSRGICWGLSPNPDHGCNKSE
jgi:hypothetical protein